MIMITRRKVYFRAMVFLERSHLREFTMCSKDDNVKWSYFLSLRYVLMKWNIYQWYLLHLVGLQGIASRLCHFCMLRGILWF